MILITGASGQLGRELALGAGARGLPFRAVGRPAFDFEAPESVAACFAATTPSLVINAAAYTAVDAAEANEPAARAGNHTGPLQLAQLCEAAGIPILHVSTDYVFDGAKGAPYVETDPTNPTGVYGATKRDGENAILATGAQAMIFRTAWVYAAHGKNFCRTMLAAARRLPALRVVADQRGTPTAAADLAAALLTVATRFKAEGWQPDWRGLYHATNAGETTWHGFATEIFRIAAALGEPAPALTAIATSDWPTPARRPADSRLDGTKLKTSLGIALPDWQTSLPAIVEALIALDSAPNISNSR
jgi:dTDP-4-dehydrorhamnose reductase